LISGSALQAKCRSAGKKTAVHTLHRHHRRSIVLPGVASVVCRKCFRGNREFVLKRYYTTRKAATDKIHFSRTRIILQTFFVGTELLKSKYYRWHAIAIVRAPRCMDFSLAATHRLLYRCLLILNVTLFHKMSLNALSPWRGGNFRSRHGVMGHLQILDAK